MTFFDDYTRLKAEGRFHELQKLIPYAGSVGLEIIEDNIDLVIVLRQKPGNIGNTQIPAVHCGVVGAHLEYAVLTTVMWEQELTAFPRIVNISKDYLRLAIATKDTFARGADQARPHGNPRAGRGLT